MATKTGFIGANPELRRINPAFLYRQISCANLLQVKQVPFNLPPLMCIRQAGAIFQNPNNRDTQVNNRNMPHCLSRKISPEPTPLTLCDLGLSLRATTPTVGVLVDSVRCLRLSGHNRINVPGTIIRNKWE